VIRQAHLIAVVLAFLIGCAVFLVAGASGVQAQASKKEQGHSPKATASQEARCQGTRTIKVASLGGEVVITNDIPGCPKGGLLLGTEGSDRTLSRKPARPSLYGGDGDDTIRGLGGSDWIHPESGDDVIYAGPGNDTVFPAGAKSSSMAGLATMILIQEMMSSGTSSIAVLAGTNTLLTRTTM
jgi:hypothetical protein